MSFLSDEIVAQLRAIKVPGADETTHAIEGEANVATERRDASSLRSSSEVSAGTRIGRYVVLERIGAGGMGVVYAAYDPDLDRRVALKLLRTRASCDDAEGQARLVREAQALARVSHANVVHVHEVGTIDNRVFLAMEFVDGVTLRHWLSEERRSARVIVDMFVRAGRGLAAVHAAGLVHRDFKPDNVVVDRSGRPRVMDFGLARAVDSTDAATPLEGAGPLEEPMTRAGVVAGTPAYMAPEQRLGRTIDGRADQFAFCVALYEALYGRLPFEAPTEEALLLEIARGPRPPPAEGLDVPERVPAILARGLAEAPGDRFPSIEALGSALGTDPSALRWRLWSSIGGVAFVLALLFAVFSQQRRESQQCKDASGSLGGVWDADRRAAVEAAFLATKKPFAARAFATTAKSLDRYAATWAAMQSEACEVGVGGPRADHQRTLRTACLRERLEDLRSLTQLLATADSQLVENGLEATEGLLPLARCADPSRLEGGAAPPADEVRVQVAAVRRSLGELRALYHAARLEQARPLAEAGVKAAEATGYGPVTAEALLLLGRVQERNREYVAAERTVHAALLAAERSRDDESRVRALTSLAFVVGYRLSRNEEGLMWLSLGRATLTRLGKNDELDGALESTLGVVLQAQGKREEALAHKLSACERLDRTLESDAPPVAACHIGLGIAYSQLRKYDEAQRQYAFALQLTERAYGNEHPTVALTQNNLGVLYRRMGRVGEALAAHERALAIREKCFGPDHVEVAGSLANIASAYMELGRNEEALSSYERAYNLRRKAFGPSNVEVANSLLSLGQVHGRLKHHDQALAYLREALATREKVGGADHVAMWPFWSSIGKEHLRGGDTRAAEESFERAIALREKASGKNDPDLLLPLTGLGRTHLARHDPKRALEPLERALKLIDEREEGDQSERADIFFALGRALWDTGARDRALELARKARSGFVASGKGNAEDLSDVDAWLAARESPTQAR